MRVDGGVPGSTRQVLAISEWDVLSIRTLVTLGQTKINNIDSILVVFVTSNQKVVRLDVPMNDSLLMYDLNSLDHLNTNMEHCLQIELSSAFCEMIFETLTEHIHNHDMEHLSALCLLVTHKMEVRDSGFTSQLMNQLGLPKQHNVLLILLSLFNLGCKVSTIFFLLDFVDLSKCSCSQLFDDLVSVA